MYWWIFCARKFPVLWFGGMFELLQYREGGGCTPYVSVCVSVFMHACLHLCLFINLGMCACMQWISNFRWWKHVRLRGGWRWGAPLLWLSCFCIWGLGGGRCVCMCQGMPAVFLAPAHSWYNWQLTGHLIHNLPWQDWTLPAHYLPTPAMWLKGKEEDEKRQRRGVEPGVESRMKRSFKVRLAQ